MPYGPHIFPRYGNIEILKAYHGQILALSGHDPFNIYKDQISLKMLIYFPRAHYARGTFAITHLYIALVERDVFFEHMEYGESLCEIKFKIEKRYRMEKCKIDYFPLSTNNSFKSIALILVHIVSYITSVTSGSW